FAAIGVLGSAGDFRMLRSAPLRGRSRIARHLWRMSLALFVAAMSFFIGQAKVIPRPMRIPPLLAVPPLVVVVTLLYWPWRVRFRRARPRFLEPETREASISAGSLAGSETGLVFARRNLAIRAAAEGSPAGGELP